MYVQFVINGRCFMECKVMVDEVTKTIASHQYYATFGLEGVVLFRRLYHSIDSDSQYNKLCSDLIPR